MKQAFLWVISISAVLAVAGFLLWRVVQALASVGEDWKAGREEEEMRQARKEQADKLAARNAERLDNGCEHHFDDTFGMFPPGVCSRCGLAEKPPQGMCDHVWKRIDGPIPGSRCEKCGKTFGGGK